MEPPPPPPPPATGPTADGSSSPPGYDGAAEGDEAGGPGFSFGAELEPLWSQLFGDPGDELEPMWSPPREFGGAGFAAAPLEDAEADDDDADGDAEGPWDGAPWRSTGLVPCEGGGAAVAPAAAGFREFVADPAAAASPAPALEVRPLDSDSAAPAPPVPPCPPAPVALEVRAPELIPGFEPAPPPPAAAAVAASSEARLEECTLNSAPSPPAPPSPDGTDLGAEDGSPSQKITSETMVVIGLPSVERPEINASTCSMTGVVAGDGASLRRSPRIVAVAAANAASLEQKIDSSPACKLRLAVSGQSSSSISDGSRHPLSATSLDETMVTPIKPVDLIDGVKLQGSPEIIATQSTSIDVVVALPVVSKKRSKNKALSVSSPRKTRSASKVPVNSNRVSAVSSVINSGPAMHKAGPDTPPMKHKLASDPSLEGVDAVLHNSGLVSANKVVSEMPLELQAESSQPPKGKRARVSPGKCSSNLKRAKSDSCSICELPMDKVTSDHENEPKLMLDKYSTDSEMVDGKDGSCFFVGEALPHEEARQRWPNRYGSIHCLPKKVGMWLHCFC